MGATGAALCGGCRDATKGAVAERQSADGQAGVVCRVLFEVVEAIWLVVDRVVVVVVLGETAVRLNRVDARDGDEETATG